MKTQKFRIRDLKGKKLEARFEDYTFNGCTTTRSIRIESVTYGSALFVIKGKNEESYAFNEESFFDLLFDGETMEQTSVGTANYRIK